MGKLQKIDTARTKPAVVFFLFSFETLGLILPVVATVNGPITILFNGS